MPEPQRGNRIRLDVVILTPRKQVGVGIKIAPDPPFLDLFYGERLPW